MIFSEEFKRKVVIEFLKTCNSISIIKKYSLTLNQLLSWKDEFLDNLEYKNRYRNQIIDKLQETNQILKQYKYIIDNSSIVSKSDTKGVITYVNDKFCEISGYSKEDLIGKPHNIIRHPEIEKTVFKEMWQTISSGNIWEGVIKNRKKDLTAYYVNTFVAPLKDKNGNIYEYIALRQDVTYLFKALNEEKKARKNKSLFLSNMSHEIRTPLNAILGFNELLLKSNNIPKKEHNYLKTIHSSGETLLEIVNEVLDLSKMENGTLKLEKAPFNPIKAIKSVFKLFKAKAKEKNIALTYKLNIDKNINIITNKYKLKQVISNLLGNAIKFTPQNGKIVLKAELNLKSSKNATLFISIKDSGIGIPKDKQELIFDEFQQSNNNIEQKYGGTGLGLNISEKIVKLLGGEIGVKSKEGEGSKFFFNINCKIKSKKKPNSDELNLFLFGKTQENYNLKYKLSKKCSNIRISSDINTIFSKELVIIPYNKYSNKLFKNFKRKIILANRDDKIPKNIREKVTIIYNDFSAFKISKILRKYLKKINKQEEKMKMKQNIKILIVDDDKINQDLLCAIFNMQKIQYDVADNGLEAFKKYEKNNDFDLILMDGQMPIMSGINSAKKIKEYERKNNIPSTPIIALTGNSMEGDREKFTEVMDDYLSKPLDFKKLQNIIKKYTHSNYSTKDVSDSIGIPEELLNDLINDFFNIVKEDMKKFELFINNKDLDNIRKIAHKIKGSSLTLKFDKSGEIASQIESLAKNGKNANYKALFLNLKESLDNYEKEI